MPKLLCIEDDINICDMIRDRLEHERYAIEFCHTGPDGLDRLLSCDYDAIILDWDLPEVSGIELLQRYREQGGRAKVIMLTGKVQISEKEVGLDAGADDYLTKPFSARELSARLRALLRRGNDIAPGLIVHGPLELDPKRAQISRFGSALPLKPGEYALLEFLMRNPGRIFSADELVNRTWATESEATDNAVRITIARLRKKIDVEGQPSMIVTVSKLGYRFEPPAGRS